MRNKSQKVLRWILRGISSLIILFSLLMFFGERSSDPMTNSEVLGLSIAGLGLIGLGLAWKWELFGGIISLAAFIGIAIMSPIVLESNLMFIWPITAILFIVLWAISRKTSFA